MRGGVSAGMTPGAARGRFSDTAQLLSWPCPRDGCKEQHSPCLPRGWPHCQHSHSIPPAPCSARLEDKSAGVVSPGGFWQLQRTVPCSEASLSAFPSSGLCLLLGQIESLNPVSPCPQRKHEGLDGDFLGNVRNWQQQLLSTSPRSLPTAQRIWRCTWHDKGHHWERDIGMAL